MKKLIVILVIVLFFFGCIKQETKQETPINNQVTVSNPRHLSLAKATQHWDKLKKMMACDRMKMEALNRRTWTNDLCDLND